MSFSVASTRKLQAGDTPGFNDEQVSRKMAAQNIEKGKACVIIAGAVTLATAANHLSQTPFVPTESTDNSTGAIGDLQIQGVGPTKEVALKLVTGATTINPDDLVQISATTGEVEAWDKADNNARYARYIGIAAGVYAKGSASPFDESLSVGRKPDEPLTAGNAGWFMLLEASAGVTV